MSWKNLVFAAVGGLVVLLIALILKRRPRNVPLGRGRGTRRRHRSVIAAGCVAPGALLTVWAFVTKASESNFGLVLGWIPGVFAAAIMGGLAYLLVESAPRSFRTASAFALAIVANAGYLALLLNYSLSPQ